MRQKIIWTLVILYILLVQFWLLTPRISPFLWQDFRQFVFQTTHIELKPHLTCVDSDGGLDPFHYGNLKVYASNKLLMHLDDVPCWNNTLTERYCTDDISIFDFQRYDCEFGCDGMVCRSERPDDMHIVQDIDDVVFHDSSNDDQIVQYIDDVILQYGHTEFILPNTYTPLIGECTWMEHHDTENCYIYSYIHARKVSEPIDQSCNDVESGKRKMLKAIKEGYCGDIEF